MPKSQHENAPGVYDKGQPLIRSSLRADRGDERAQYLVAMRPISLTTPQAIDTPDISCSDPAMPVVGSRSRWRREKVSEPDGTASARLHNETANVLVSHKVTATKRGRGSKHLQVIRCDSVVLDREWDEFSKLSVRKES